MTEYRYLVDFDAGRIRIEHHDAIIVGSGIAGVYTALELSPDCDIAILTKEKIEISNSSLAQGGIAVSLDKNDSPELHFRDTINAGAGLCDEENVWVLVREAAGNIEKLRNTGVQFDTGSKGELSLTREAAHSKNRIIHAGDSTGKEVLDTLIAVVYTKKNIHIKERTLAVDLLTENGRCLGILAYDYDSAGYIIYESDIVICASGGFGKIYEYTTNPEVATGDGLGMAYRAGIELMDMEFVQFHPTVLYHPQNRSFLISEAVRGEGAILLNILGERFMPGYHEAAELAPRDIVSRAIFAEMKRTKSTNVFLDITFKGKEYLENRFPMIYKTCSEYGILMEKDHIPVAPAEHYCMGGIRADVFGHTSIRGFYACGECACTGIHGANRLASNSLLEGLVFGSKIGAEINGMLKTVQSRLSGEATAKLRYATGRKIGDADISDITAGMRSAMNDKVGIIRNGEGLQSALDEINSYYKEVNDIAHKDMEMIELKNMLLISRLVIESALERKESRGAHFRSDYPETDNIHWKRNIIKKVTDGGN
jgi:L-aspartate oxidase